MIKDTASDELVKDYTHRPIVKDERFKDKAFNYQT